jgi:hypothetical protein
MGSAHQGRYPAEKPGDTAQKVRVEHMAMHNIRSKVADEGRETEYSPYVRYTSFHVQRVKRDVLRFQLTHVRGWFNHAHYANRPASHLQLSDEANDLRFGTPESQGRDKDDNPPGPFRVGSFQTVPCHLC